METNQTKRIAAIVFSPNEKHILLLENLDPEIQMIAFPNWNLHKETNSEDTLKKLLYKRTGYKAISYINALEGKIEWKFRKPKNGMINELGVYNDSVYIVKLTSLESDDIVDDSHEVVWTAVDKLDSYFATDGSNGSSFMIWNLYRHHYPKK